MLRTQSVEHSGDKMSVVEREFVSLVSATGQRNGVGFNTCQGLYHRPSGSRPRIAFIATHYNVDFSEHYLAALLAERGFGFLGWNTRFRGNEAFFLLEHALIDIGAGADWLNREAGVETVVLLGNSGGGSLMAAYQSQALGVTMTPTPGLQLPQALHQLTAADLYVSLCAHGGRPEVLTAWFDPAIANETDPSSVVAELDMYNPANGPPFTADFVARYRAAQVQRNHRISQWCHAELARIRPLGMSDRAFNVYRTWADLRLIDGSLDPSNRQVGLCYAGDPQKANYSPRGIGLTNTLRTWLSMWSLSDSHCSGEKHLQRILQPAFVIQSDADTGVFPSDAQAIYAGLGSADKHLEMIAGDHYLETPADGRQVAADMIAAWANSRA